ncbi:MAG: hypothetical protein K8S98_19180 [Planctomycetes bacterium]|nr:hypothetical protein [Planctomycetota bacterium]
MPVYRRRFRIVRPTLQLSLILSFIGVSTLALLLQYTLFVRVALSIAADRAEGNVPQLDAVGGDLMKVLAVSFVVMLPLTLLVGILVTHKFAGPIYRFEVYLKQVIAGEKPADCRLRKGDELQSLCDLINTATEPLRRRADQPAQPEAVAPRQDLAA